MSETTKKSSKYGYLILASMILVCLSCQYACSELIPVADKYMAKYGFDAVQYGKIYSAWNGPGMWVALIIGLIVDRFGPKYVVGAGVTISGLAIVLRMFCGGYTAQYLLMFLAGVATGMMNAVAPKILSQWFPAARITFYAGLYYMSFNLVSSTATIITAFMSLETAFTISSVIAVIATAFWWIFMRNSNPDAPIKSEGEEERASFKESLLVCLKNKNIWIIGVMQLLIMAGYIAILPYMVVALTEKWGTSAAQGGVYTAMISYACVAGCLFAPALVEKIGTYRWSLLGCFAVIGIGFYLMYAIQPGFITIIVACIIGVALAAIWPVMDCHTVLIKEIGPKYAATGNGIITTLKLLGAAYISSYVVVPMFNKDYNTLFLAGSIIIVIGGLLALLLPECGPKGRAKAAEENK